MSGDQDAILPATECNAEEAKNFLRLQLAEIDTAVGALGWMRERLLDRYDHLIAGKCEHCGIELFTGDQGHRCLDGEPIFCAEHAWTWAQVKESYQGEGCLETEDPAAYLAFMERLQLHVAGGGSIEDKVLHVL